MQDVDAHLADRTDGLMEARHAIVADHALQWPAGITLAELERLAILQTLESVHGNTAKTAELLGVSRPTLYDLMNHHGLK